LNALIKNGLPGRKTFLKAFILKVAVKPKQENRIFK
jgi:hypothetical protein